MYLEYFCPDKLDVPIEESYKYVDLMYQKYFDWGFKHRDSSVDSDTFSCNDFVLSIKKKLVKEENWGEKHK